jgi:hypothetical protein
LNRCDGSHTVRFPCQEHDVPALATWTPEDGLLGALAPLGLALAAGTALVVDLDPLGPSYPGESSLASLVSAGPRRADLTPRPGIGVLRNGGVPIDEAAPVVDALVSSHRTVVLRLPPRPAPDGFPHPVVPVRLLVPGGLFTALDGPAVYQATPSWSPMPTPGVRLPVPHRSTVAALLVGRRPAGRDRWVRAWQSAWRLQWRR